MEERFNNPTDPMPGQEQLLPKRESMAHPRHYEEQGIEPREYIRANKLNFNEGNIVKYITRHKKKDGFRDIIKVITYGIFELEDEYEFTPSQIDEVLSDIMANIKHRYNG